MLLHRDCIILGSTINSVSLVILHVFFNFHSLVNLLDKSSVVLHEHLLLHDGIFFWVVLLISIFLLVVHLLLLHL